MGMGQPALLYLVPCTLGVLIFQSRRDGRLTELWNGPPQLATTYYAPLSSPSSSSSTSSSSSSSAPSSSARGGGALGGRESPSSFGHMGAPNQTAGLEEEEDTHLLGTFPNLVDV